MKKHSNHDTWHLHANIGEHPHYLSFTFVFLTLFLKIFPITLTWHFIMLFKVATWREPLHMEEISGTLHASCMIWKDEEDDMWYHIHLEVSIKHFARET